MQVNELIDALDEAVTIIDRNDLGDTTQAAKVLAHGKQRLGLSQAHTVIALAGTTGSGKSTLFNAIIGHDLATPGVKRPTTGEPMAVVFGGLHEAVPLLDALQIAKRHYAEHPPAELDGLVLVDLPDFDSFEQSNRAHAERLIGTADAIVWVTDPQKYADASLHQDFLQPMRAHAPVLEVVLNQADRLAPDQVQRVLTDLKRLLDDDGVVGVDPLAVSGVTGEGIPALRLRLAQRVAAREAIVQRVATDLRQTLASLPGAEAARTPATLAKADILKAMTPSLAAGVGADQVAEAVRAQTRRSVFLQAGWPPMRWLERWRKVPVATVTRPGVSPLAEAHVSAALRAAADPMAKALGPAWQPRVKRLIDDAHAPILAGLDQAASRTLSLPDALPGWVGLLKATQFIGMFAVIIGVLWLTALRLVGAFLLVDVQTLREAAIPIGALPAPTWLVVIGLVVGLVATLLASIGGSLLAKKRGDAAVAQLLGGINHLIDEHLRTPLETITTDATQLATHQRSIKPLT